MTKCKHCEAQLTELPVPNEGFAKPTLPVFLCGVCDSGDDPKDGALALAQRRSDEAAA